MDSIVVYDGTSYFVEERGFILVEDEFQVFKGTYDECVQKCEELNE